MEANDVLGIAPYGEALKDTVSRTFDGLESFLAVVFKPGLEELGGMLKDQIRTWRLNNVLKVLEKAKGRLGYDGKNLQVQANARVGIAIFDECSKVDDEELQELWAGLFASSCTSDGIDDSNIIFVDILKRLSSVEARILAYACEHCEKMLCSNGLILAKSFQMNLAELKTITGINDVYRLDRELDHLSSLSLFGEFVGSQGGFIASDKELVAHITPSALALNLYYKTHALNMSVIEFWKDELLPYSTDDKIVDAEIKKIFEES